MTSSAFSRRHRATRLPSATSRRGVAPHAAWCLDRASPASRSIECIAPTPEPCEAARNKHRRLELRKREAADPNPAFRNGSLSQEAIDMLVGLTRRRRLRGEDRRLLEEMMIAVGSNRALIRRGHGCISTSIVLPAIRAWEQVGQKQLAATLLTMSRRQPLVVAGNQLDTSRMTKRELRHTAAARG